jgi:hypothetical protein
MNPSNAQNNKEAIQSQALSTLVIMNEATTPSQQRWKRSTALLNTNQQSKSGKQ